MMSCSHESSHNTYQLPHFELLPYTSHVCSAIDLQCQEQISDVNDDSDDDVLMMPILMILMMLIKTRIGGRGRY